MRRRLVGCLLIASLALTGGCRPIAPKPSAWEGFRDGFLEAYFRARPSFAVYQGRHEFDGQFPDWSDAGLRRWIAELHRWRDSAIGIDSAGLSSPERFEREYLVAQIDKDLFWNETAEWPWKNPAYYGSALDPNVYVARPYTPPATRLRALTRWLAGVPEALGQIRANLRTPLPRPYVEIGRIRFGGLIGFLSRDAPAVFAGVSDTALQHSYRAATDSAVAALKAMDDWLAAQLPHATGDFAMGPELFAKMLRETEQVDVPLAALDSLGRADLRRNREALRAACEEFAPHAPVAECVRRADLKKPAGGPIAGARAQLVLLKEFLTDAKLVSIPGQEKPEVEESPPYQRWNFAYIDIPGPYEHGLPSVYYIAPPDPNWSAAEQAEYIPGESQLLFTSVHEVWPGHFLQFLHSNRAASPFGQVFVGYAFAEGWAHYSEEMMWDAGLGKGDPLFHIGQLREALLRDARFLSAIGLHTGGMTLAQAEALFRNEAYTDAATARQQAARGTFDPAYLNYTMGKLMIRRLREDWTRSRGGRAAWQSFHDAFLSYGGPPIPLVRRAMLGPDNGSPF
jgi:hypothetical protein